VIGLFGILSALDLSLLNENVIPGGWSVTAFWEFPSWRRVGSEFKLEKVLPILFSKAYGYLDLCLAG